MESLKNKSTIDKLFEEGRKIYTPTIKAVFMKGNHETLISAPIKIFKRAVDRNKIKRLIRESVKTKMNYGFTIALIYNTNEIKSFDEIDRDITEIYSKLNQFL